MPFDHGFSTAGSLSNARSILLPEASIRGRQLRVDPADVDERPFAIDLTSPLPSSTGRYAQASLPRIRPRLDGRMNADDLATLDALLDSDGPDGVLRPNDLAVRTYRTV
jgi:hypothetical protein